MPIETSADARKSRRHAAGVDHAGRAADDRGYLAAAASRFSLWWHGDRRPPALTADADLGAGLLGGPTDLDPQPNGDANPAPSEDCQPRLKSNQGGMGSEASSFIRNNTGTEPAPIARYSAHPMSIGVVGSPRAIYLTSLPVDDCYGAVVTEGLPGALDHPGPALLYPQAEGRGNVWLTKRR